MNSRLTRIWDNLRPLDPLRSIKVKIGILVVTSISAAALVFLYGVEWVPPRTFLTAVLVALVVTQLLAHGMTSPLRAMTAAARAMARGDYSRRVRATSRDEVGELARAFNQMAADLEAADRQRRELIANVSHELRTPISALQAVLENLVDGVSASDPETLRTALAQTERLGSLVADLWDLSRLDAGVVPLDRERFEVRPWLAEAAREVAVGSHARVLIDVEPADLTAVGDHARLHQVVANLLNNAVRHGPNDGTVTVTAWTSDGGDLVLEVADEGPGIPAAQRFRVFQRFTGGGRGSRSGRASSRGCHSVTDRLVPPRTDRLVPARPWRAGRVEWLVPMVPLVLMFGGFVAVQLAVLFGGDGHVLRTAGLTYAEYARTGFGCGRGTGVGPAARAAAFLLAPIEEDLREPDPWYAYNASRERARVLLERHPVRHDVTCGYRAEFPY